MHAAGNSICLPERMLQAPRLEIAAPHPPARPPVGTVQLQQAITDATQAGEGAEETPGKGPQTLDAQLLA